MSLIEVMTSQVIALVVISAVLSLVVALVKKLNSETSISDAQVRLRQVTHMILRDTQGVGGDASSSGDVVFVVDGGVGGADQFTIFKRDESVCGGGVSITGTDGVTADVEDVDVDLSSTTNLQCPFTQASCPASEIGQRTMLVVGGARVLTLRTQTANAASCNVNFPTGQQLTDAVAEYNARYGTSHANINQVLTEVSPVALMFGTSFTYRLSGQNLERSTDGVTFEVILDNVFDMQVERIYFDDDLTAAGLHNARATTGTALPANFEEDEFLGLRVGFVTFASARADLEVAPPASFSNRSLAGAPTGRRYRGSFIFAASRNRTGA